MAYNPYIKTKDGKSFYNQTEERDWGSLAFGGLSMAGDFMNISNQRLNLGNPDMDFGEVPSYDLGDYINRTSQAKAQGADAGEVLGGFAKGAATGAKFGGAPGAIIGGVAGGLANLIGGGIRKRKQQSEIRKARRSAFNAQQAYNKTASDYNTNQMAMQEYYRNLNPYERETALY